MLDAGRHEQDVAGVEGMSDRTIHEITASQGDHVDLVSRMRLLRINVTGSVELDRQCSSLEGCDESLTVGSREALDPFGKLSVEPIRQSILIHRRLPC